MFSAPMCSGRSMYFDPASSALARTAGPRSIVTDATIAAASSATSIVRQSAGVAEDRMARGGA